MKAELYNRPYISAFRVITNPFDSFERIKENNHGAFWQVLVSVLVFFLVRIFNLVFGGFLFNKTELSDVNLWVEFIAVVTIFLLFVIANKNFCDLTDGDGTTLEVALVTSFALLPYSVVSFVNLLLSNFFVLREGSFMSILTVLGLLWSVVVALVGLKAVHRYSFGKTVVTVLITFIFMALIAFLCALIFLITQELIIFISDIYTEIVFRL